MITLNKILPADVWNEKKHLTRIELNAEKNNFNPNYRKDSGLYKGYKAIDLKTGAEIVDIRFYNTTGRARGYGYNRESAAFNEAICNCGIKNFPRFGGSGCNEWAIKIILKILGVKKYKIVEFHA